MKNLIILLLSVIVFISCEKEDVWDYSNIEYEEDVIENTTSEDSYTYNGTVGNDWDNGNSNNPLVGSKWVITRYNFNFNVLTPNDTIHFISNSKYLFNSSTLERTYSINRQTNNNSYELRINFLPTLGGGVYVGQIPIMFDDDGFINNATFNDIEFDNRIYNVWLEKVN